MSATSNSSVGTQVCITNTKSPPHPQYLQTLLQMIKVPTFVEYSNGRCWIWTPTFSVTSPTASSSFFVFDRFSVRARLSLALLYPTLFSLYWEIQTGRHKSSWPDVRLALSRLLKIDGEFSGVPTITLVGHIEQRLAQWSSVEVERRLLLGRNVDRIWNESYLWP